MTVRGWYGSLKRSFAKVILNKWWVSEHFLMLTDLLKRATWETILKKSVYSPSSCLFFKFEVKNLERLVL
jgi:hypothetical protein